MHYIDGFIAAVPNDNKEKYIQHAKDAALVFKEYGANQIVECWGDDVPEGSKTSLPMAVQYKETETVVFSWIEWPSKTVRDDAWAKLMKDERMQSNTMPFDGSRLIYGGFQAVVCA